MKRRNYRFETENGTRVVLTLFKDGEGKWTLTGGCNEGGEWRPHEPREIHFKDGEDAVYALNIYRGIAESQGWKLLSKEEDE